MVYNIFMKEKEVLLLIDGNSLLNRAYYAMPPLSDGSGRNVNAVYGFINLLIKAIEDKKPQFLVVTFDTKGKNFRHELFEGYKATRKGMPDELAVQLPVLKDLLKIMKITMCEKQGAEADDLIGTLATIFDVNTLILSGDKDLLQLVNEKNTVLLTKKGVTDLVTVTEQTIVPLFNMEARQIVDYKALRGDMSDNIPGVTGIGETGAFKLLGSFGALDEIFLHIDEISGALKEKLIKGKEMAYLSKKLATIVTDIETGLKLEDCKLKLPFDFSVKTALEKLQFRSLIKRLEFSETTPPAAGTETSVDIKTVNITTGDELQELVKLFLTKPSTAVHIADSIFLAFDFQTDYVIKCADNFAEVLYFDNVLATLKPLLETKPIICYDGKALMHFCRMRGVENLTIDCDLSLMQYLIQHRSINDLLTLSLQYGFSGTACAMYKLKETICIELEDNNQLSLYYDIELPLSKVLYDMELTGVGVDSSALESLLLTYSGEIKLLTSKVHELAGEEFNILSPKQLAVILFDKLKLPHGRKTASGYSTDADTLSKLTAEHEIVPLVLKIRQLSKICGTYLEGIKPFIKNGKIHTTFNQSLTTTGRLSSSEPNLQNIPIRNDLGREIRKMFIPLNGIFISADYSQIELRLLAHFSGDEHLIQAFNNDVDIHALVASQIFGVPIEMVTSNMRRTAKAVNFGIIYGISDFGLAGNVGISPFQARKYIQQYFETYPQIKGYLDSSVQMAREKGYVTTISGRRRLIPEIKSNNFSVRSFGERAAANMPLQGSAADIMKIAMVNLYKRLNEESLKSKIVLQIHDELVIDAFPGEEKKIAAILKEEMENAIVCKILLSVNVSVGKNLYETK